jgi:hypothetical protein
VSSLFLLTTLSLDLTCDMNLILFVFFGTVFGYNFIKFLDKFKSVRGKFKNKKMQFIVLLTVLSSLLSGFFFIELPERIKGFLILPLLSTVFYTIPFAKKYTLRTISGLKVFVIAISWAYVTVLIPSLENSAIPLRSVILLFLQITGFIIALMIPFEIRDLDSDPKALKTIPQRLGTIKSKVLGLLILICCSLIEFMKNPSVSDYSYVLWIVCCITGITLLFAKKNQSKYYTSVLVESIPILWLVLAYFFAN